MAKSASSPAEKPTSWTDRKNQLEWKLKAGSRIAKKLSSFAKYIHKGDDSNLHTFYADALELKTLYPQYGKFINRAITTIQSPESKYVLDRIEWMVERNSDPSEFYKIVLKD